MNTYSTNNPIDFSGLTNAVNKPKAVTPGAVLSNVIIPPNVNTNSVNSTPSGFPTSQPTYEQLQTKQTPVESQENVTEMYSPELGPSTQKVADATYTSKILDSVGNTSSVPSTDITSGATYTGANAKRSSNEATLQSFLEQQKEYFTQATADRKALRESMLPTAEERAAAKRYTSLKTQAGLNQEQALGSGETSSFAGGEAQRVARTDALKLAGASEELQYLQSKREVTIKNLEALLSSGRDDFKTQLDIQKLQNEVSGIDKQAQDTFFNLQQSNPGVSYNYDTTKTPTENLNEFRKLVASQPDTVSTAKQQQTVSQIVGQFDNEPVVKNYNVVAEGYQFAKNLADKPKLTSADNIGLIYAFAKAMDPGSVVREGEYATVQKYAQSWAESFGFNVQRVLTNKEFLTKEAITNLVSTMDAKYAASEKSYRNIESEYQRKITEAKSGAVAGSLTDYSKGYTPSAGGTPKTTTGTGKIYKTKYGDIDGSL